MSGGGGDGPLNLFFGPVIGHETADIAVSATAALVSGVGFRISGGSAANAEVLPITYDTISWDEMLGGLGPDNYSYDPSTGAITPGSDGIREIDLYPNSDNSLPAGNRGTVDFGSSSNATSDLERQILYGLNDDDLSYFGGEINLENGPLTINGDTGISAALKAPLNVIKGLPRAIPLFSEVHSPGNNAMYTVVRFVGIRILEVKLTGGNKYLMVQPAPFVASPVVRDAGPPTMTYDSIVGAPLLIH